MAVYKIGYVDEQISERADFQNLMEDDIDDIEVTIFDVDSETSLDDLLNEVLDSEIECLVVDYHLSTTGVQFEGSELIQQFHKIRPYFPKIIYTNKEAKVIPEVENEIIYLINDKSIKGDEKRESDFKLKLKTLIDNYRQDISFAKSRLDDLVAKKLAGDLSMEEENELFQRKSFLVNLDTRRSIFPEIINTKEYFDELRNVHSKIDELILRIRNEQNSTI